MSMIRVLKNRYFKSNSDRFVKYLRAEGVAVGENVRFIQPRSNFVDLTRPHLITIGNDVRITNGVVLLTHGYEYFVLKNCFGGREYGSAGEVKIGNNVYIGINAILLKGVTVGSNVIIGAGSIVAKNIPDNSVAAGNPAKIICSLNELHKKNAERQTDEAKTDIKSFYLRYGRYPNEHEVKEFTYLLKSRGGTFDTFEHFIEDSQER